MGGALTVLTDTCAVFTIHDRQQRHSAAGGLCSQSIPTPPTTALSPPHLILSPALHHGTNVKGKTVACGDMMARACVIHIAHVARQNARRVSELRLRACAQIQEYRAPEQTKLQRLLRNNMK